MQYSVPFFRLLTYLSTLMLGYWVVHYCAGQSKIRRYHHDDEEVGSMTIEMTCPTCGSHDISKNGTSHRGKQNYKCRDCGRQFVENPQWQPKPKETKALVNRLLHEKIPLAGIARAAAVSKSWLQGHAHALYGSVTQTAAVLPKPKGPLTVQMDELWSFVDHKGNQQWVWLAMDAET